MSKETQSPSKQYYDLEEQIRNIKTSILVLCGYLPNDKLLSDTLQNTTAMHFIKLIAEAIIKVEHCLQGINN